MRRFAGVCRAASRIARFFKHHPVPLAMPEPPLPDAGAATPVPVMCTYRCSETETKQIPSVARSLASPLSAILLRDWIHALDEWNRASSSPNAARPVRIVMPVNLRSECGPQTALNAVSLAFIDRDAGQLQDERQLLAGLVDEIDEAKQLRGGMALLPALRLVGMVPGELQRQLRADRCLGSAIFSNMGVPFANSSVVRSDGRLEVGGVVVESVEAVAPLRPLTHASMAVLTFANRLQFMLSADPHFFTEELARSLMQRFVHRVCRTAAITTPSGEWLPSLQPSRAAGSPVECV